MQTLNRLPPICGLAMSERFPDFLKQLIVCKLDNFYVECDIRLSIGLRRGLPSLFIEERPKDSTQTFNITLRRIHCRLTRCEALKLLTQLQPFDVLIIRHRTKQSTPPRTQT